MAGSKSKTKGNYCFPNFLGKVMAKVGQRVQFESSLLSMALILIGILIMTAVTIFGTNLSLFIKIIAGVNGIAALIFLSSHLITTFQQYQAYLSIMGILDEGIVEDKPEENKTNEKKVNKQIKEESPQVIKNEYEEVIDEQIKEEQSQTIKGGYIPQPNK